MGRATRGRRSKRPGRTSLGWLLAALLGSSFACGTSKTHGPGAGQAGEKPVDGGACPAEAPAPETLPGVGTEQLEADYWATRQPDPDAVLMGAQAIADHNAGLRSHDATDPEATPIAPYDLAASESNVRFGKELRERLDYMRERVADGRYVDAKGAKVSAAPFALPDPLPRAGEVVRVALADIPLWCGPVAKGLFKGPDVDPAFDRNACTTLRAQEPVKILAPWGEDLWLVRTPMAMGFMPKTGPLSPALSEEERRTWLGGAAYRLDTETTLAGVKLAAGRRLPRRADEVLVATKSGVQRVPAPAGAPTPRPLTRRALVEEAFRYLGKPYGWGGRNGWDCSRFLVDVFAGFGIDLPRHSGVQRQAGELMIDLEKAKGRQERLGLLDAAHGTGVVLLHFPGHIMLYLGRGGDGRPMAIHAFAEYLEPCEGGGETRRTVDRIQVSDLSLGDHTSRRAFIDRITHVTVIGGRPGPELLGVVSRRPAAPMAQLPDKTCKNDGESRLWTTPRRPYPGAPLRAVVSGPTELGSVRLTFFDPDGKRHEPELHRLGGPPFGYWAEVPSPAEGTWQVQIGEGERIEACERTKVYARGDAVQRAGSSVWRPRHSWNRHYERLYSIWIEQLFDYPLDDRTWTNLQSLLTAADKNLLHGFLATGEDGNLALQPDCADLPYFLRAYFSWKMRLPFAFRRCNRGFKGQAPYCDRKLESHLEGVEARTETGAFEEFARRNIADGVHSGSGRTGPALEDTDYYPLPLTREAIRPGVIFADPYGHLFVIAGWHPQGIGDYGVLVGADAQPDKTIGRRRFWPGSFLFSPDTKEAGAGFKAFRPLSYGGGRIRAPKNEAIGKMEGIAPFSMQQYELSKADFYDRVEGLINPRPLDPKAMLGVLVDAFYEQAKRRVVSVQNAVDYKAEHRGAIEMPLGHKIFETTGAWENYSTPSRDMRLLIALDTVLGFPAAVKRQPQRFGVGPDRAEAVEADLQAALKAALAKRSITYRRSDGSETTLTLAELVARQKGLEMAYNPNDCVEIRWGAPEGSDERGTCKTFAPAAQRDRMKSYRSWFATRQRPSR